RDGGTPGRQRPRRRTHHFLAGDGVLDGDVVVRLALPAHFDRHWLGPPRLQCVVGPARLPLVPAAVILVESAGPVTLGGVAGAGETEHVAGLVAGTEDAAQGLMHGAAALAVAPAGHDDGARDETGPLLAHPSSGRQELFGMIRLPVGQ